MFFFIYLSDCKPLRRGLRKNKYLKNLASFVKSVISYLVCGATFKLVVIELHCE